MIAKPNYQSSVFFLRLSFITIFIFVFSQSLEASTTTPDTFLNLEEVDELTKSVIKINQISNNKSLEYLFKKNKKESTLFVRHKKTQNKPYQLLFYKDIYLIYFYQ